MPHCAATVLPSMNPSRVQCRRYVIPDCACHSFSAVLSDQWCCLLASKGTRLAVVMKISRLRGILRGFKDPSVLASKDNDQRARPLCCGKRSQGRRSARIEPGRLVEGKAA